MNNLTRVREVGQEIRNALHAPDLSSNPGSVYGTLDTTTSTPPQKKKRISIMEGRGSKGWCACLSIGSILGPHGPVMLDVTLTERIKTIAVRVMGPSLGMTCLPGTLGSF